MIIWPETLPQKPLLDGWSDEIQSDAIIRSSVSTGLAKQRPRYTAVNDDVTEKYLLTQDQALVLRDFYKDDLKFGALKFEKPDPLMGNIRRYRFAGVPPKIERQGIFFVAELTLEKLAQ